jgi:hypothetical protein
MRRGLVIMVAAASLLVVGVPAASAATTWAF